MARTTRKSKMETPGASPEIEQVADRLHSAAIHLLRRVRKQDEASGIGPAQLSALSVLVFGGPTTLGGLASAEMVKPPTMSRIVDALTRNGLAESVVDENDSRRLRIRATARGITLLQKGRRRRIKYLTEHLGNLPSEEVQRLEEAVEIIRKLLENWE